ncbi:maleylpyruvate isomerase N-terminal domain-containing protein [Mycobacterium terramassiliense]|uniref:maleylpyruvate isomerase N-terminal domain-containing protein n=1 Tax=Mycobacterium terramassiliense TaxID=1841859 RepID=UPI0009FA8697|nr:maleylpyruvate isomerase N-terminal domain-containing protein [Mycobacterium terramassiliense]
MTIDRVTALRRERDELVVTCRGLTDAEWLSPSAAAGWTIKDVIAHIGSGCHAPFSREMLLVRRSQDIERTNDILVDRRRGWTPGQVLGEYERWSKVSVRMLAAQSRTPLGRLPARLAELGTFPLALMASALTFDHYVHLRHDIAPVIGRRIQPADANRVAVVIEWMLAVLCNQLRLAEPNWFVQPMTIRLVGPGGGCWVVHPGGRLEVGSVPPAVAEVVSSAINFPHWATTRAHWREHDISILGDHDYATQFLDAVNVI